MCKGEGISVLTPEYAVGFPQEKLDKLSELRGAVATYSDGQKFIFLSSLFKGEIDLFTAFHELGHHFFKHQGYSYSQETGLDLSNLNNTKEVEADAFAELATGLKGGNYV